MDRILSDEMIIKCNCECDGNLRVLSHGDLYKVLGYDNSQAFEEKCGDEIINIISDKDKKDFLKTFLLTNINYGKPTGAYRVINKDGSTQTLLVSAVLADDNSNKIVMSFYDPIFAYNESLITKARLDMLLDNIQAGVALVELKDKPELIFYNKGIEKICNNAQRNATEKRSVTEIINSISNDEFVDRARKYLSDKTPIDYNFEVNSKPSNFYFRIRGMVVPYEGTDNPVFMVIVNDISDYKKTERRLEEMTDELTGVINNVPGGIAMFSVTEDDVNLEYANDMLYELIGSSKEHYSQLSKMDLSDFIHENDFAAVITGIRECATTASDREFVFRLLAVDGRMTWCHASLAANKIEKGRASILAVIVDITAQQEMSEMMKVSQEKFKLAFEQTNAIIWEYDINNDMVYTSVAPLSISDSKEMMVTDPFAYFVDNGIVCEESADEFRNLIDMIKRGEPKGSCIIKIKAAGVIKWCEVSYVTVFDSDNKPSTAVCISKDVDNMSEIQQRFTQEEVLFDMMTGIDGVICIIGNLSKNKMMKVHGYHREEFMDVKGVSWDEFIVSDSEFTIPPNSAEDFRNVFTSKGMLDSYHTGVESIEKRYKRQYIDGKIKWVSYFVNMITNPVSGDVYAFGYVREVDSITQAELALDKNPERAKSGLYDLNTVRSMSKIMIGKNSDEEKSSIFILGLYNYGGKLSATNKGGRLSDKTFAFIARIIKLIFGGACIVGDIGENRLIVVVPSVVSDKWLVNTIDKTLSTVNMNYSLFGVNGMFEYSVGVCTEYTKSADFDKMVKNAQHSLAQAQAHISIHESQNHERRTQSGDASVEALKTEMFIKCGLNMLGEEPMDVSLKKSLREIGQFYKADRAYLMEFKPGDGVGTLTSEWCALCVDSHEDLMTHIDFQDYSFIVRAQDSGNPMVVEDVEMLQNTREAEDLRSFDVNSIFVIPFTLENGTKGFIGVDNPGYIEQDMETLKSVGSIIVGELNVERLKSDKEYFKLHNNLTGLLNRTSFNEYITGFKPDAISTLGIMTADVNSLKHINEKFGTDYGNNVLKYIAGCLKNHFEEHEIYKFAGDEFVIICENYAKESFEAKVVAARREMEQAYPGLVSTGSIWAKEDIDVDRLIYNAEELMMINKQKYYQSGDILNRYYDPAQGKELKKHIDEGHFVLYLQPKADTSTGNIIGAEALVRMMDPEKGLVFPDKFIPTFERNNMIRYIDLYMFEETLRILQEWQNQGLELIPISLNFSRATVLEADILDTMEEIYKKYSDVDRKYVEIEITESMGDMEVETLKNICVGIVNKGYHIALDDFGSKYSSMVMLTTIKFNVIKVDKSMIHDILINPMSKILMGNIFTACKEMDVSVVAEGVETQEQLDILCEIGCPIAQGYLFNKAIPYKDFESKYIAIA